MLKRKNYSLKKITVILTCLGFAFLLLPGVSQAAKRQSFDYNPLNLDLFVSHLSIPVAVDNFIVFPFTQTELLPTVTSTKSTTKSNLIFSTLDDSISKKPANGED